MFNNVHYLNSDYVYKLNDFKTRYRWWISSSRSHFYQQYRSREAQSLQWLGYRLENRGTAVRFQTVARYFFFPPQGSDNLWSLQTPKFKGCWCEETALQLSLRSLIHFLGLHRYMRICVATKSLFVPTTYFESF